MPQVPHIAVVAAFEGVLIVGVHFPLGLRAAIPLISTAPTPQQRRVKAFMLRSETSAEPAQRRTDGRRKLSGASKLPDRLVDLIYCVKLALTFLVWFTVLFHRLTPPARQHQEPLST